MKIRLLKDSRMYGRTGETIEASPELCEFLTSVGMAEAAAEAREQAEAPAKQEVKPAKAAAKGRKK